MVSGANTKGILALTWAIPEVKNVVLVLVIPIPLLNNVALFASFEKDLVYKVDNELDPTGPVTYNGVTPVVGGANVKGILPVTGGVLVKKDMSALGWSTLVYNVARFFASGDFTYNGASKIGNLWPILKDNKLTVCVLPETDKENPDGITPLIPLAKIDPLLNSLISLSVIVAALICSGTKSGLLFKVPIFWCVISNPPNKLFLLKNAAPIGDPLSETL